MANIFVAASATWNGKALKKAKQDVSVFDKQVKKLGGTLAAAFSVRTIVRFGREAVKAFAADEAAAKSLEIQLKNTGYQFSSPAVELYIANLQRTTGVLDDQLRPAFQQLLTVTGSITMSQDALNTAMDVSAATGKSLTAVTTALSRAYAGNTTGLSRLGAGLNKALLKTGDMDAIMAELNNKFSGQAIARLDTYAGKLSLLSVAAANSREIIGKGLLDALSALGKDNSIASVTNSMEDFATATSEVLVGLGKVAGKLKDITNIPGIDGSFLRNLPGIGAVIRGTELLRGAGRQQQDRGGQERTATRIAAQQRALEIRAIKNATTLRKAENDQLKKKTEVDKLAEQFNVTLIGLQKALGETVDEETKARLRGLIAIEKNDEALAKKALAELAAAEAARRLAATYDQALESVKLMNAKIAAFLTSMSVKGFDIPGLDSLTGAGTISTGGGGGGITGTLGGSVFDPSFARRGEERSMAELKITVDTQATGDRFATLIAESLQIAQKSGVSYGIAGGL